MGIRSFQEKDIPAVQNILKEGEPYVFAYKEYVYWILERYFQIPMFMKKIQKFWVI